MGTGCGTAIGRGGVFRIGTLSIDEDGGYFGVSFGEILGILGGGGLP